MVATATLPRRAFRNLDVNSIVFSDFDLRTAINAEALDGLMQTMNEFGTLQPIVVSHNSKTKKYEVIIGGRRLRAAIRSGQPTIPAFIMDNVGDKSALVMMLIENMQRKDLEALEEARGMAELRDRFNYSEEQIASTLSQRVHFVHDRLALLRLPKKIQQQIERGRLGVSQATCITHLEGQGKVQLAIAEEAEARMLPLEVVERMVKEAATAKRRYKKIKRKYKLKKRGEPLSEAHMKKKLQQIVLRGERFLSLLDSVPLQRWRPAEAKQLSDAISAIEEGLQRFERRAIQRGKEKN